MEKKFLIEGFLVDQQEKKAVAELEIEAWEKDSKRDDLLGKATSATDGSFSFAFSDKDYRDYRGFIEDAPKVYFKVFSKDNLLTTTSPQKINPTKSINILRRVIEIPATSKSGDTIQINDWDDITEHEGKILDRIKALNNGSRSFISNPLLCLSEVGVMLSDKFRQVLIAQQPTLATKSSTIFRAIINNEADKKLNINLKGLFRRNDK